MVSQEQLSHFANLVQLQQTNRYARSYPHSPIPSVRIVPGRKYVKVDIGSSGLYMVEVDTGDIYGIKAYGVINHRKYYGNIATVDSWNTWG